MNLFGQPRLLGVVIMYSVAKLVKVDLELARVEQGLALLELVEVAL